MKWILFTIFFLLIKGQTDDYEKLINEKVSEEYCNDVITNLTTIIDEVYVYSDFLKAPKQPIGYENYFSTVDLVKELNAIPKTDRYFYEFYRDILNVLEKARDGHFSFSATQTPNNFKLENYYFCIPFRYKIKEVFNEENILNDIYLTIEPLNSCKDGYSKETIEKINELEGKKIEKINELSPYEYLDKMGRKFKPMRSPQGSYILIISVIHNLYLDLYPFKKEELNISLEFEGNEALQLEYQFNEIKFFSQGFKQYYNEKKNAFFKKGYSIIDFEKLKNDFKIKKGLLPRKTIQEVIWFLEDNEGLIKCNVDDENEYNIIYQNSFSPQNYEDYFYVLEECFEEFYSNDYKIIIIEDKNGGGYSDLSTLFTEYLRPKINKGNFNAVKSSQMNQEYVTSSQIINPDSCMPYTDKDNILEGTEDKYSDEIIHKKSKIFDVSDIYNKKYRMSKRKSFLEREIKMPTEIIIFTDGYSFSAASSLINGLQVYGAAIIVGYNSRPDLEKKYFDSSQSYSMVHDYEELELVKNLHNLGFSVSITIGEAFNPNDRNNPKTPFEFLVNPVDEIAEIYQEYDDNIYDRFIQEANKIFNKYNDLENGECNPDNKYLFYETSDCDSKLNIEKAHGGYLCGADGKWDKNNCIAAYCDDGYILNDERTLCIKDLCEEVNIEEKELNITQQEEFILEPKTFYYFSFNENDNNSYYFLSEKDNYIFYYDDNSKVYINNQTLVDSKRNLLVNYYLNISEQTKLLVKKFENSTDNTDNTNNTNNTNNTDNENHTNHTDNEDKDEKNTNKKLFSWSTQLIAIGGLLLGAILLLSILKLF